MSSAIDTIDANEPIWKSAKPTTNKPTLSTKLNISFDSTPMISDTTNITIDTGNTAIKDSFNFCTKRLFFTSITLSLSSVLDFIILIKQKRPNHTK